MPNEIRFSEKERTQLHLLLSQDLESSRVELHHTAGQPYREYVKQRMQQTQALLKKLDQSLPVLEEVIEARD